MRSALSVVTNEMEREIERLEEMEADALAIRMKLPEWGFYMRCHDLGLGYTKQITSQWKPGVWGKYEDNLPARIPRISDDDAMAIDNAIVNLGHPFSLAIVKVYLNLESYRTLTRYWQRQHCVAIGKLSMVLPY